MAVPKKKTSKQRKRTRRANWKLSLPGISECPQCHKSKLTHRVCRHCGYYNGKQVIETGEDAKTKK
jgi:large subunit ribosomal protein L32